jgi:NitT/TauT family transport system substrate-binding protein
MPLCALSEAKGMVMIMKNKSIILTALALSLILILSGCAASGAGSDTGTGAGSDANRPLTKFNVGYLASTGHIMYFIAQEKGFFNEEGLDVELALFSNSGEGINAVLAGKLDAGSFGTAPPFTFIAKGNEVTIFGGQMTEGHAIIAQPELADQFKDIASFKGKTIATVRLATGDIALRSALHNAGIDWKTEVTINEMESPAAVLEAVKKGSADAGVVWSPYRKMSEDQGLKIVFYSGELNNLTGHPCCRQIAVTERLAENPGNYERFLRALIKAYDFYKSNHEESLDIMSKYISIDKEILEAETYGDHIGSSPDPNKEGVVKFWNAMKDAGYIESDLDIADYVNTQLYSAALDGLIQENPENANYAELKANFKG